MNRRGFFTQMASVSALLVVLLSPFRVIERVFSWESPAVARSWEWSPGYWYMEMGREPRDSKGYLHVRNYFVSGMLLHDTGIDTNEWSKSSQSVNKFVKQMQPYFPSGSTIIGVCKPSNRSGLVFNICNDTFPPVPQGYMFEEITVEKLA